MPRILTAFFLLHLTLVAIAQDARRAWVLTTDDFRARWPAHYRVKPADEKLEAKEFMGIGAYMYYYMDKQVPIVIVSQLHKEASSLDAQLNYTAFKWASKGDDSDAVDYSGQVKAGQASQCRSFRSSSSWMFACRQKRVWGFVMVSGLKLKPAEMDRIVKNYVKRLETLQAPKKRPKRGIWRF